MLFTRGALLGFWLFGTVACSVLGDDGGQEARVDHSGDIAGQVKTLVKLTGAEYVKKRDDLLKLVEGNSKQFSELRKTTKDWKVRLLCDILLERASKERETDRFLKWEPGDLFEECNRVPERPRGGSTEGVESRRIRVLGGAMARHGRPVPMVLVERLWKSTSWKKWRLDEEKDAYLCRALGILNVAAARELLEEKLQDEMVLTKREAAKALGYIADVRSVRPLFALMEREPESDDSAFGAAAMAISRCADRETIPFLKEKASKSKSKIVKVMIKTIVSGLEKASE